MLAHAEEAHLDGYDDVVADADDEYERVKLEFAKAQTEYQETLRKQEEQDRLQREQQSQEQQGGMILLKHICSFSRLGRSTSILSRFGRRKQTVKFVYVLLQSYHP